MALCIWQRIFIVEYYSMYFGLFNLNSNEKVSNNKVIEKCQFEYERQYKTEAPTRVTITKLITKFKEIGNVENREYKRKISVLTEETIENMKTAIQKPHSSIRRVSAQLDMSFGSVYNAIRKIGLFPYKVRIFHQLKPIDFGLRLQHCYRILTNFDNIVLKTFFSDESWIHLSGYINRQNTRQWALEKPTNFLECPLHSEKIGVWCMVRYVV